MDNVLKVSVALVDPEANWDLMNEAYDEFLYEEQARALVLGRDGVPAQGAVDAGGLHRVRRLMTTLHVRIRKDRKLARHCHTEKQFWPNWAWTTKPGPR
jgi:hypothetical protein